MTVYLNCMKTAKSKSTDCRESSKAYLGCRMDKFVILLSSFCTAGSCDTCDRGLMERVSWEDLGFTDGVDASAPSKHPQPSTSDVN